MRKIIPTPPQLGDVRVVEKFLLFPKTLPWEGSYSGTRIRVWWEMVKIKQTFRRCYGFDGTFYTWCDDHFVEEK